MCFSGNAGTHSRTHTEETGRQRERQPVRRLTWPLLSCKSIASRCDKCTVKGGKQSFFFIRTPCSTLHPPVLSPASVTRAKSWLMAATCAQHVNRQDAPVSWKKKCIEMNPFKKKKTLPLIGWASCLSRSKRANQVFYRQPSQVATARGLSLVQHQLSVAAQRRAAMYWDLLCTDVWDFRLMQVQRQVTGMCSEYLTLIPPQLQLQRALHESKKKKVSSPHLQTKPPSILKCCTVPPSVCAFLGSRLGFMRTGGLDLTATWPLSVPVITPGLVVSARLVYFSPPHLHMCVRRVT